MFERAADLGGTWRDNSYPGCACDVPSHLYSFSFAPNPDWTQHVLRRSRRSGTTCAAASTGSAYARTCGFDHEVREAAWDDDAPALADRRPRGGDWTADVLVAATGPLSEPAIPTCPGLETFRGHGLPLRPVGPRPRPDRPARRGHRHRRVGDPVRARRSSRDVARLHAVPAHPAWVLPRPTAPHQPRSSRRSTARFPALQRMRAPRIYWSRESGVIGFLRPRLMRLAQRVAQRHLRASGAPTRRCARKLTPRLRDGLQAGPALQRLLPGADPATTSTS